MERTTIRPIVGRVPPLARPRKAADGSGGDLSRDAAERDLLNKDGDRGHPPAGAAEIAGPTGRPVPDRPSVPEEARDDQHQPFPIRLAPDVALAAGYDPDYAPSAGEPTRPQNAARSYHRQADMLGRIRAGTIRSPVGRMTDEEA